MVRKDSTSLSPILRPTTATMISKLCVLSALVAAASAQLQLPAGVSASLCLDYPYCTEQNIPRAELANPALRYPAGVSASVCLDYPYCSESAGVPQPYASVAATGTPAANPLPLAPAPVSANPALAYPAGVSASLCLDYPYCTQGAGIAPTAQANPALRYPAGVSASVCINYPYCD